MTAITTKEHFKLKSKHEFSLKKMSTNYFKVLFKVLEDYGGHLLDQADDDILSTYNKDHSITLELYFIVEAKVTSKQLFKPESELKKGNKSLKIKVHQGIVVLDAIFHYQPRREFYETPALEHIKEQICQELL